MIYYYGFSVKLMILLFCAIFFSELDITCGELDLVNNVIAKALSDKNIPFSIIESRTPQEISLPSIISKVLKGKPSSPMYVSLIYFSCFYCCTIYCKYTFLM